MDFFKKYEKEIEEIAIIHNFTKHYILLGEELSDEFETYLQPVKEFRDAYEHIVRVFTKSVGLDDSLKSIEKEEYIRKNLNKALGHEYRAFFDVADWFSIICRKKIYEIVQKYTYEELCNIYPKYQEMKIRLYTISEEIATIRDKKDISNNIFEEVNRYQYALVELLGYYRELIKCNL
jgi:hypothetical protein